MQCLFYSILSQSLSSTPVICQILDILISILTSGFGYVLSIYRRKKLYKVWSFAKPPSTPPPPPPPDWQMTRHFTIFCTLPLSIQYFAKLLIYWLICISNTHTLLGLAIPFKRQVKDNIVCLCNRYLLSSSFFLGQIKNKFLDLLFTSRMRFGGDDYHEGMES